MRKWYSEMENPVTFEEYLSKELKDPEFKAEWDALEPEFQTARMIIEKMQERQVKEL